jgi:hypothetical protein
MTLAKDPHQAELRAAGWHSRGYLPHFDGIVIPQFVSLHLADAVPRKVIERWKRELDAKTSTLDKILLQRRIEKYADQGYGKAYITNDRLAEMVQETLLKDDGKKYRLSAWVIMPIMSTSWPRDSRITRCRTSCSLSNPSRRIRRIRLSGGAGQFWMLEYFDRYIRNAKHYQKTVEYIENNPAKARLCARPEDYRFSSAWFRAHAAR